jgi:hypothetical protein
MSADVLSQNAWSWARLRLQSADGELEGKSLKTENDIIIVLCGQLLLFIYSHKAQYGTCCGPLENSSSTPPAASRTSGRLVLFRAPITRGEETKAIVAIRPQRANFPERRLAEKRTTGQYQRQSSPSPSSGFSSKIAAPTSRIRRSWGPREFRLPSGHRKSLVW